MRESLLFSCVEQMISQFHMALASFVLQYRAFYGESLSPFPCNFARAFYHRERSARSFPDKKAEASPFADASGFPLLS